MEKLNERIERIGSLITMLDETDWGFCPDSQEAAWLQTFLDKVERLQHRLEKKLEKMDPLPVIDP